MRCEGSGTDAADKAVELESAGRADDAAAAGDDEDEAVVPLGGARAACGIGDGCDRTTTKGRRVVLRSPSRSRRRGWKSGGSILWVARARAALRGLYR